MAGELDPDDADVAAGTGAAHSGRPAAALLGPAADRVVIGRGLAFACHHVVLPAASRTDAACTSGRRTRVTGTPAQVRIDLRPPASQLQVSGRALAPLVGACSRPGDLTAVSRHVAIGVPERLPGRQRPPRSTAVGATVPPARPAVAPASADGDHSRADRGRRSRTSGTARTGPRSRDRLLHLPLPAAPPGGPQRADVSVGPALRLGHRSHSVPFAPRKYM